MTRARYAVAVHLHDIQVSLYHFKHSLFDGIFGLQKRYGSENVQYDLEPFRRLDEALYHLAQSLSVVIIPGPSDPTSLALPQSAIKAGVLPLASKIGAFRSFPNPSSFEIDALRFVVSSGQGLDDMARYTKDFSRLALAEFSLACRHLCPSAPDTLCMTYRLRQSAMMLTRLL